MCFKELKWWNNEWNNLKVYGITKQALIYLKKDWMNIPEKKYFIVIKML